MSGPCSPAAQSEPAYVIILAQGWVGWDREGKRLLDLNSELRPLLHKDEFNYPFRRFRRNGWTQAICNCTSVGTPKAQSDSRHLNASAFPWDVI